jgi:hypothetical protein
MLGLLQERSIAPPDRQPREICGDAGFGARVLSIDVPRIMEGGRTYMCRLRIENAGERGWLPNHPEHQARVALAIDVNGTRTRTVEIHQNVHRGERWHISFEVTPPPGVRRFAVRVRLLGEHQGFSERLGPVIVSEDIVVEAPVRGGPLSWAAVFRNYLGRARTESEP